MSTQKIKILGIAPYEGMKSIMLQLAEERTDLELDVFVGDLENGVEIAQRNFHSNYDAIISRGGTAELIGRSTHIPVIEVSLSVYDILRAIKLAENYADRYAIVGFPGITGSAHLLCDLLQYKIDIFTIHDESEVHETLSSLKAKGYRMVLCDMIANTTARRLGLNALLITSGAEGISSAFDQAVKLSRSYIALKSENRFLKNIIQHESNHTVVLTDDGSICFSSLDENEVSPILDILLKELPMVLSNENHKFFKNIDGTLYSFLCRKLRYHNKDCAVYYFSSSSIPLSSGKHGIQYCNQPQAEEPFFHNFYNLFGSADHILKYVESIGKTTLPIMILGESGTGKELLAKKLHSQSSFKNNPMIMVNCAMLTEKSWNFLTNHLNSPFNDSNNTIFIKDISLLSEQRRTQLLSIVADMNVHKRNYMIFSCISSAQNSIPPEALAFVNLLACLTMHLPALRERAGDIPTLSSLYLNDLNVTMASQIIGFEPKAMELLQNYSWPYNYPQFQRILNELALITATPYIGREDVAAFLKKEQNHALTPRTDTANQAFDLNKPLNEINQDIILSVLKKCDGNQSAAAKQLGISRTTLWRYLK